jgi:hypothetical protein
MANFAVKNGIWLVRFRFVGKEFKRLLKTSSRRDAEAAHRAVEWTIHRLSTGQLQLPPDVDAGDFIVSGLDLRSRICDLAFWLLECRPRLRRAITRERRLS